MKDTTKAILLVGAGLIGTAGWTFYRKYQKIKAVKEGAPCCRHCGDPGCIPVRKCTYEFRCDNCNCEL